MDLGRPLLVPGVCDFMGQFVAGIAGVHFLKVSADIARLATRPPQSPYALSSKLCGGRCVRPGLAAVS